MGATCRIYRELHNCNREKDEPVRMHCKGCMVGSSQVTMIYCLRSRDLSGTSR